MNALKKLYLSGLTPQGVAAALSQSPQSVSFYARGKRFPSRDAFAALVELAESRGLTLLASDFLSPQPADHQGPAVTAQHKGVAADADQRHDIAAGQSA